MAASVVMHTSVNILACFLVFLVSFTLSEPLLYTFQPKDVLAKLETACFIAVNQESPLELLSRFADLAAVFEEDERVVVGIVDFNGFIWQDGRKLEIKGYGCKNHGDPMKINCYKEIPDILYFPQIIKDRTCLMSPPYRNPEAEAFEGSNSLDILVTFVNSKCGTFRTVEGILSSAGLHREQIIQNLFKVSDISDTTMKMLYSDVYDNPLKNTYCFRDENQNHCDTKSKHMYSPKNQEKKELLEDVNYAGNPPEIPKCPVINLPLSKQEFFDEYLTQSKPVIIKNAVNHWPAMMKWSQDFFREQFGKRDVHIKMTPGGDFEGVEPADKWEDFDTFSIPEEIISKLPYPDLVVVRPAGISMKFAEFLDLITWAAQQPSRNVSAYLEYSSISDYFPELKEDLEEFDFVKSLLKLRHLNMWLSDGNTLGRLHFDPFDNFLCQLRGRKQVTLFEPYNNEKLYEAHIPQATLGYMKHNHTFRRRKLEDSTSMVMSPVDLLNPDFQRFPKFAAAHPLNCTIEEGDALYMPAFWWHEVYSWPNEHEKRNLAVNFWYDPFLKKEFPCPECKMDINPMYHHLLY